MVFCRNCGSQIAREAVVCIHCGVRVSGPQDPLTRALAPEEGRSWVVTLILACLMPLGICGVHRFYTGHIVIGVVQLLTFGLCGIWQIIDIIIILVGNYQDVDGKPLVK
jgi:hypothetical protein